MVTTCRLSLICCLMLICMGAQWEDGALVRGYRAYQRGDLELAIEAYQQALLESTDPGRVAYDLGTVYAKAKQFHDAAWSFTRSLEDARGLRQVKSAYGLGTALTELAAPLRGRRAVGALKQALQSFDLASRSLAGLTQVEKAANTTLPGDIEHNRQVAQALLARKLQEPPDPKDEQESNSSEEPSLSEILSGNRSGNSTNQREPFANNQERGGAGNSESNPGRGNLPPLPDADPMPPISAEEAMRRLEDLKKRLKKPLHTTPALPGSRDW